MAGWRITSLAAKCRRDVKGILLEPLGTGPMLCLKARNSILFCGLKAQDCCDSISCFSSLSWCLRIGREIQDHFTCIPTIEQWKRKWEELAHLPRDREVSNRLAPFQGLLSFVYKDPWEPRENLCQQKHHRSLQDGCERAPTEHVFRSLSLWVICPFSQSPVSICDDAGLLAVVFLSLFSHPQWR